MLSSLPVYSATSFAPGFDDGAHDVDGLIAIERRDLDRPDVRNLGELTPEPIREHAPAHRRLQIEAEQWNDFGDRAAMREQLVVARVSEAAEAEKPGVVAECRGQLGFAGCLRRRPADAGDHREGPVGFGVGARLVDRQLEHGTEKTDSRVSDGELRRVHAHGHAACAGVDVVAREPTLACFVE